MSECASEVAEPSPGPSGTSEQQVLGDVDDKPLEDLDEKQWPSINDLNTRLRRVITTYQRNYRKEELKLAQKAKVRFSNVLPYFTASCLIKYLFMFLREITQGTFIYFGHFYFVLFM